MVAATIESGRGAHGVTVDAASRYAYVTNTFAGNVSVVDLARRQVVAHIPVGKEPGGISFSPIAPSKAPARTIRLPLPSMSDAMTDMKG
jgi:YVTN family beta-propeller protein